MNKEKREVKELCTMALNHKIADDEKNLHQWLQLGTVLWDNYTNHIILCVLVLCTSTISVLWNPDPQLVII